MSSLPIPNNYSRQDIWHDSVSYSYPPLTFAVTTDPVSGIRDGILKRPGTDPLVFQVDSANEFWQMNASLNVHDGRGGRCQSRTTCGSISARATSTAAGRAC